MAFNLQKVLRALLFSSSQALSVKDIQNLFARFHEQTTLPLASDADEATEAKVGETPASATDGEPPASPENTLPPEPSEPAEVPVLAPEDTSDAELYRDVPSLITATQIREAMAVIAEELRASNDIYLLIEGPTGFRVVTHPRFARWIRIMRDEPPPVKLTQSALETLAIISYRQPVTRTEIETIRGVSAEAGLNKLLERELVYITGRADLPGRPLQYGTTDKFLDFVGVKSLVELPSSDVLSPRQIDEWLKNAIQSKPPTDQEMGLPLEEGEGPSPSLENVSFDADSTAAPEAIAIDANATLATLAAGDEPASATEESSATASSDTVAAPEPSGDTAPDKSDTPSA